MEIGYAEEIEKMAKEAIASRHSKNPFIPGESPVPVTGKVFGVEEISYHRCASAKWWAL